MFLNNNMKKFLFFSLTFLLITAGNALALELPPPAAAKCELDAIAEYNQGESDTLSYWQKVKQCYLDNDAEEFLSDFYKLFDPASEQWQTSAKNIDCARDPSFCPQQADEVAACLEALNKEYMEKRGEMKHGEYFTRYKNCYVDNVATDKLPNAFRNLTGKENFSILDCQAEATWLYTGDEYIAKLSECYQKNSLNWIWDMPALKQTLIDQFKDYTQLYSEKSLQLWQCIGGTDKTYNYDEISAETEKALAKCFSDAGYLNIADVHSKSAVAIDCAQETIKTVEINGVKDIFGLIKQKTPKQEAYLKQCIIKKTSPIVAGIAVVNVPFAAGLQNFLLYFQFTFTQFGLLFVRRKKQDWGRVYNSLNNQPLDLSTVRLYNKDKVVVRTMVTGRDGNYLFLPTAGEYQLDVLKSDYDFPSDFKKIRPDKDDYLGGQIKIQRANEIIDKDVPMDPNLTLPSIKKFYWKKYKRRACVLIAFGAPLASLIFLLLVQIWWTYLLVGWNIITLCLFWRLNHKIKTTKFGVVYDEKTKKPLSGVFVSLFEKKFNKLLSYYVTDMFGRYFFPAEPGEYSVVLNRKGYQKKEILAQVAPRHNIKIDVVLVKQN
ncbi:MAG: hypothetical protein A2921_03255 [Candidatus Magasanikbacteria bacterium RIFCSPLOWO2_01_FULL_43_20b]|uniref:Carboxypeptidase regulatory-like domain-containing protein n=1 Tax=Candidatus Magasanikbacteria bacterium RIFCSPLOWO2_12_FULL_43_12 TaxID=1798692 RepID=A0A1F6MSR7_9BACT|nr:MAG: hypothetical protein A3I93_03615 [Candidatus Magasanikbacteria bacterium RIFCSPLOWO2_02_FULL_43_22]OGH73049.1 MAG: hypothetical protein A2921_03255 [Candidatus Magasanikbacteria bacterium RIFCSPLOWO2_01_FULL_43_20b]OGH74483.1 MAG: hypothetical protein A3G00_00300 [Candidatus Magasanikbacteria bacterium RIFCSPLOWO2_12_FULL_43_12]